MSSDGALTCSSVPIVASSEARDPDEYPVRQASKRHPGSYVVEYSAKAGLCNSMLFEPSTDPNRPYWHIALPATGAADLLEEDVEPSGGHEPKVVLSNFDMNNDGTLESVVSIHFESRTRESTTFFAQRDDAVEKTGTEFDGAFLQEHTALVFPHTWSGCRGGFNWADAQSWDDQGCRVPLKHYKHTYDITHLRLRPFRSGGKTYFLGLEPHYLSGSIVTVWEPQASGAAKEVCIFRQVVNNY
jgi:hypothetical protein